MSRNPHNLARRILEGRDYGQSLYHHPQALELFRSSSDNAAASSLTAMGTIFEYQGRYGAALEIQRRSSQGVPGNGRSRSSWMDIDLSGYGKLTQSGGPYDEAERLSRL